MQGVPHYTKCSIPPALEDEVVRLAEQRHSGPVIVEKLRAQGCITSAASVARCLRRKRGEAQAVTWKPVIDTMLSDVLSDWSELNDIRDQLAQIVDFRMAVDSIIGEDERRIIGSEHHLRNLERLLVERLRFSGVTRLAGAYHVAQVHLWERDERRARETEANVAAPVVAACPPPEPAEIAPAPPAPPVAPTPPPVPSANPSSKCDEMMAPLQSRVGLLVAAVPVIAAMLLGAFRLGHAWPKVAQPTANSAVHRGLAGSASHSGVSSTLLHGRLLTSPVPTRCDAPRRAVLAVGRRPTAPFSRQCFSGQRDNRRASPLDCDHGRDCRQTATCAHRPPPGVGGGRLHRLPLLC